MNAPLLKAWVHTLRYEAQDIISVELRPAQGEVFPAFEAGAHIDLHLPGGLVRSYSLTNNGQAPTCYRLGVLKDKASRGGSRSVHEQLRVGMPLSISAPRNHFPLAAQAQHSVLIAGGIGVTPILCMARHLAATGQSYEVIYLARTRKAAAFMGDLQELGATVHWHFDDEAGGPLDLKALLAQRASVHPAPTTHYYACGPGPLLDAFVAVCTKLGLPHAHIERFGAAPAPVANDARKQFTVELRKSGRTFEVTQVTTLHKQLKAINANVPFSCEEGICGSCETRVIEGTPDHRDMVLSDAEKASNRAMMVCVSGCKTERLVLDL